MEQGRENQARTGRDIHGLPKVSCGPAMPDPYMPCVRATPQTALRPCGGWPARRAGCLRPSSFPLDTPSRTGLGKIEGILRPHGVGAERISIQEGKLRYKTKNKKVRISRSGSAAVRQTALRNNITDY
jgi:hypothetical protein